ncbi:MAG TPA: nucleotidyl transferase AbiEii/AbiGii toxin family protein [Pyrinomonadaceae bacterium]|nr:nucleotidyl transferase AbiEii/AbiGii toxin family protein [Pyrinomonadaceae bacterium]
MIPIVKTAFEIQNFLEKKDWRFCIIGGIALQIRGEPRLTNDVDLTLLTGFGNEEVYVRALIEKFIPRIKNAEEFALKNRVLLLKTEDKIGIDISLGALPLEEEAISRASYEKYLPGISLKICSSEDLIILKAFADRLRDWADIETVIIKQDKLDWDYIYRQLTPLVELKDAPEILEKLERIKTGF